MNYIVAVLHSSAIRQRHLLSSGLFHTGALVLSGETAAAETPVAGPTYRTLRAPPEIPVATAVILLRTTQEAERWRAEGPRKQCNSEVFPATHGSICLLN